MHEFDWTRTVIQRPFYIIICIGNKLSAFPYSLPCDDKRSFGKQNRNRYELFYGRRRVGPLLVTAVWGLEGIYKLMSLGLIASFILYLKLKDFNLDRAPKKAKEKVTLENF